jgi:hypothetical protein
MGDQRASIGLGFQVEDPLVFLPWGTPIEKVRELFAERVVSVQDDIIDVKFTVLGGLECGALLHGDRGFGQSTRRGLLSMVSFWIPGQMPETYPIVQQHLEATFGPPMETISAKGECPAEYKWVFKDVLVGHHADYRAGWQERALIRKGG